MKNNTSIINTSRNMENNNPTLLYSIEASVFQTVSLIIIIIFGLSGNGYMCYLIHRSNNLKNPTLMFILSLAFSNIGALALCTPFPLAVSMRRRFSSSTWWCVASGFLSSFFFCASILTLSLITTHKYFTVVKPTTWTCLQLTEKRPKLCLAAIWVICALISFMALGPFSGWGYMTFNVTTAHCGISFPASFQQKCRLVVLSLLAFVVPLFLMTYAYLRIYLKVNAHEKRLSNTGTIKGASPMKRKLTVTLCLMFGTFVACWSPFFVLIVMAVVFESASDLPVALGRVAYWFGYINCCINPVLYCTRTSTFKEMMRGRLTSLPTLVNVEPRTRRAYSLPVLPTKTRRLSSVMVALGSASISPARIIFDTQTSHLYGHEILRIPRMRALSWTASYTVAAKISENVQKSQKRSPIHFSTRRFLRNHEKRNATTENPVNHQPTINESVNEPTDKKDAGTVPSLLLSPCMESLPQTNRKSVRIPEQHILEINEI